MIILSRITTGCAVPPVALDSAKMFTVGLFLQTLEKQKNTFTRYAGNVITTFASTLNFFFAVARRKLFN